MSKLITYSTFCQKFYHDRESVLKGVTSKHKTARYFFTILLDDDDVCDDPSYLRKIYTGESPADVYLNKMADCLEHDTVFDALQKKIKKDKLSQLAESFGVSNEKSVDAEAFINALVNQIKELVEHGGRANDVVANEYANATAVEFPVYRKKAEAKFSKIYTLLYADEEQPFYDFFVCNKIRNHRRAIENNKSVIENVTLDKLAESSPFIILVGMGGIGKSMMMRHLFLQSLKNSRTEKFPIIVTLRDFGDEFDNIYDLMWNSVHKFDKSFLKEYFCKLLEDGKCQLLLDGLDEIKEEFIDKFLHQLDEFADRYTSCQYVISTRNFLDFMNMPRFKVMDMLPFNKLQALELIDKLVYFPNEPSIKEKFRELLDKSLFRTHKEFARNPLLLTIMLMNYKFFAEIPEKRHRFYKQAYATLLRSHDNSKPVAYRRAFRSVVDPDDFTNVFSEFCAKSYRKGVYKFGQEDFEIFYDKIKSIEHIDSCRMKLRNFKYDVCHSTCLMYEEGGYYHFLHRSFQEYFFAEYYSRQSDEIIKKLGRKIDLKEGKMNIDIYALSMLYDIAPDKVEQFIILPYLKSIFDGKSGDTLYWNFMKKGYGDWEYIITDGSTLKKYGINREPSNMYTYGPDSLRMQLIIENVLKKRSKINVNINFTDNNYAKQELANGFFYGLIHIRKGGKKFYEFLRVKDGDNQEFILNRHIEFIKKIYNNSCQVIKDDNGELVKFGTFYSFDFDLAISSPELYHDFLCLWKEKVKEVYDNFKNIEKYYHRLIAKYENNTDEDDDDF